MLVGLVNTAVGYGVIYALVVLGINVYLANLCGYALGLVISFTLNKRFTFRSNARALPELRRFLGVFGVSLAAAEGTVWAVSEGLGLRPEWASLVGMAAYTATNYLLNKHYVFASRTSA